MQTNDLATPCNHVAGILNRTQTGQLQFSESWGIMFLRYKTTIDQAYTPFCHHFILTWLSIFSVFASCPSLSPNNTIYELLVSLKTYAVQELASLVMRDVNWPVCIVSKKAMSIRMTLAKSFSRTEQAMRRWTSSCAKDFNPPALWSVPKGVGRY